MVDPLSFHAETFRPKEKTKKTRNFLCLLPLLFDRNKSVALNALFCSRLQLWTVSYFIGKEGKKKALLNPLLGTKIIPERI